MSTISQPTGAIALEQPGVLPQQPQMALPQPQLPIQQPAPIQQAMPIQQPAPIQQLAPMDTMKPAMAAAPPSSAAALPVQQPLPGTTTTTTTTTTPAAGGIVPTVEGQHLPVRTNCPYCSGNVVTEVRPKMGGLAWGLCIGLCIFLPPTCCIPCFVDSCKDARHYCPQCQREIGIDKGHCTC